MVVKHGIYRRGGIACRTTSPNRAGLFGSDYDGTNDYAVRGAELTGNVDGKAGTVSIWIQVDVGVANTSYLRLFNNGTGDFISLFRNGDPYNSGPRGAWTMYGENSAGTKILELTGSTAIDQDSTWHHLLYSWDLASGLGHFYLDDTEDEAGTPTLTNDTLDYTRAAFGFGAEAGGANKFNGSNSEAYINFAEYVDITVEANRRDFITAGGKPAWMGSDGSLPTGTAPIIYAPDGNPVQNRGTGGDFTMNGAVDSVTGPGV